MLLSQVQWGTGGTLSADQYDNLSKQCLLHLGAYCGICTGFLIATTCVCASLPFKQLRTCSCTQVMVLKYVKTNILLTMALDASILATCSTFCYLGGRSCCLGVRSDSVKAYQVQ